jgi:hypothetical protein
MRSALQSAAKVLSAGTISSSDKQHDSQGIISWHNFLLGQTARQFEAIQQEHITATRQWNSAPFWAKNLTLALWDFSWTIWKHRNQTLHDRTGVDQIPQRELNASVTQEWQNGDTELLPQDKALIQGTSLPQLLQTSQDHKLVGWRRSG